MNMVIDVLRQGLWTELVVTAPILIVSLMVGLVIGLLQALTSVQESTLTFVPKLAAVLVTLWLGMDVMGQALIAYFTDRILPLIEAV